MNAADSPIATYVTRLTSLAPSAISVIEICGPSSIDLLCRCWQPATSIPLRLNAIRYGKWLHDLPAKQGDSVDSTSESSAKQVVEDVVVCRTSSETVEIHCHGGRVASDRIVRKLIEAGAHERSQTEWRDASVADRWTRDAFNDLLKTSTPLTTQLMLAQSRGALGIEMETIESMIAQRQYDTAIERIDRLLARFSFGKHLTVPWKLAIVGPPNVGKSCLLNAIVGYERAIVHATAGTTRDIVNECTSLLGWPIEILDTAGLRSTDDYVEAEGVRRAKSSMNEADLALCLVDSTVGWTEVHEDLYSATKGRKLFACTKTDLGCALPEVPHALSPIQISAQSGDGLDGLYHAIVTALIPEPPQPSDAIPFRAEHDSYLLELKNQALQRALL